MEEKSWMLAASMPGIAKHQRLIETQGFRKGNPFLSQACNFIKKETSAQMLTFKFCEIF